MWQRLPTQEAFCDAIATAKRWDIPAYIGAFGSGKSHAICRATLGLALSHPGIVILVGRYNATDLKDTTQATWFSLINDVDDAIRAQLPKKSRAAFSSIGTFHKGTNEFEFTVLGQGSRILFRSLEEAERKYKSLTLGAFGIDEASEVDRDRQEPASVLMLQGRLRQMAMPCVGYLVSNPTGFDHWLYRWYGAAHGATTGPKGYPVFRAKTDENAANLPPGYVEKLRETYPAAHVRRYLDGEWGGIDEGRPIYPTFDPPRHIRELAWHPRREVHVGIDIGTEAPGVVWGQIDGRSERLHILRSWGPTNLSAQKLGIGIRERTQVWFPNATCRYYAGHDAKAHKDTNEQSSADILREILGAPLHVSWRPTELGFNTIRALLEPRDDGEPGLYVAPENPLVIEGFAGGYRYDPKKEDKPQKGGRYPPLMDAVRYIAVHRFTPGGRMPTMQSVPAFRGIAPRNRAGDGFPTEKVARRTTLIPLRRGA